MNRFFAESIVDENITLSGEDINHIVNVLRLKTGERIIVSDGLGHDYVCEIAEIGKKSIGLKVIENFRNEAEPYVNITLFQGIPKLDKMELIIQKCVELGVSRFVPVETRRAVVKIKDNKKTDRWQKIAEAAAKQSGRGIVPTVTESVSFKKALWEMAGFDLALMPYEMEKAQRIKDVWPKENVKNVAIFIGPEGGIDDTEALECAEKGVVPVTLGKRILRTETAGFAAVILLLNELGEM
ncbi:MAG: 16S rRNA (uracil(1498)-N(3))-methyltransferase [Clostridiales bacterium]|jgi:16S rRNA (uracil1498-N3)-methyltransferase|nr:16S rRNA (uracil(1498)-N(3))-methyltransferase [Clostridiales bacterium]